MPSGFQKLRVYQLAVALDISPNHAKVVLHRARKRLRAAVALDDGVAAPAGDA